MTTRSLGIRSLADGIGVVTVTEVPEPRTATLLFFATLAAAIRSRKA